MADKKIVMTGGTGALGSGLATLLRARGDEVVAIRRGPGPDQWQPSEGRLDPRLLEGAAAVVNFNGIGLGDTRWTEERKRALVSSRVDPTSLLAETMAQMDAPPPAFVSASAVGIYGDTGDEVADESYPPGDDFLAQLCVQWEQAAAPAADAGVRVVHPRTGITIHRGEGALARMTLPFKLGIGGRIGDGQQWWSWISIRDALRAYEHLIDTDIAGPVNLVAPNPVTNEQFTKAFGAVLHRPTVIPTPKLALKILLGRELAESIGYGSTRASARKLIDSGFEFTSETVEAALQEAFPNS
jgi:uncharacterized protein (TIGR01777 family)